MKWPGVKDVEVAQMKEKRSLAGLKKQLINAPPTRDFIGALKEANARTGFPGFIAEGSFENLEAIRNFGVQCPLLCKEFVIDAWQLFYARLKGDNAILLIAAVLPDLDIKYMIKICKLLGLTALVKVHDEREMDRVLEIEGIELVGINNRDLGIISKIVQISIVINVVSIFVLPICC
ncbi:indole-3-glycerol phosphate synthase chloroplastic [Phtheirospermum japonicum]|uniref:indole-3-glycerol-phosphate synthase n=1 Tax=Phtheirospermum japonicum TaxID=374723 RepID=A0A830CDQ2_9LAMI|nr:indole-3-glycerol phosphate synthase chloroplastic [Phtheirospermum japonicum]